MQMDDTVLIMSTLFPNDVKHGQIIADQAVDSISGDSCHCRDKKPIDSGCTYSLHVSLLETSALLPLKHFEEKLLQVFSL